LADSSAQARGAARFSSAVSRGLRESAVIAIAIGALVLFMALVSYSPDDPGFSFTGNAAPVHNRIGVIGAWLADVLFFLFGRPAFLFPLVLAAACWALQRRLTAESTSRANTLVRIFGFLLVLVASCAFTGSRACCARAPGAWSAGWSARVSPRGWISWVRHSS